MRYTEFWRRMEATLGSAYARSWAADFHVAALGGRTVNEALADGDAAREVWRAVCATIEVPTSLR